MRFATEEKYSCNCLLYTNDIFAVFSVLWHLLFRLDLCVFREFENRIPKKSEVVLYLKIYIRQTLAYT